MSSRLLDAFRDVMQWRQRCTCDNCRGLAEGDVVSFPPRRGDKTGRQIGTVCTIDSDLCAIEYDGGRVVMVLRSDLLHVVLAPEAQA